MKQSVFHERMETPTTQGKVAHKLVPMMNLFMIWGF